MSYKQCSKCKETLPVSRFHHRADQPHKLRSHCKACLNEYTKAHQRLHRRRISYKYVLKTKYGLTLEDYERMEKTQRGKCAICKETPKRNLVVDHCHGTGKVRGLLCNTCNTGIGGLRDSLQLVKSALKYLTVHQ